MNKRMHRSLLTIIFMAVTCSSMAQFFIPYQRSDLWGLVERGMNSGVLTPRYTKMTPLGDGYFDVSQQDSNVVIIDSTGKETISLPYGTVLFTGNGLLRYSDKSNRHIWYHVSGRKLQMDNKEVARAGKCFDGRLMYANHDNKEGFLDVYGTVVVKAAYDEVSGFYNGYASVRNGKNVGAIDSLGNIIIPLQYEMVQSLNNGLFSVHRKNKAALADKTGRLLTPFEFEYIHEFFEGVAWVAKGNQRWYINEQGKNEWPKKFTKASSFENGMAIVNDGKNDLFINRHGEILYKVPAQYTVKGGMEGIFFELEESKTGKKSIVNKTGQPLFTNMDKLPHEATRSYCVVEQKGKYGLINELGNLVLPLNFDKLKYVKELDIWYAVKDVDYGYIDQFGQKYWIKK